MRPIDFRLNGVSAEWDGAPNASNSVIKVNGSEVARNLFKNPFPYSSDYFGTEAYSYRIEVGPGSPSNTWLVGILTDDYPKDVTNMGIGVHTSIRNNEDINFSLYAKTSKDCRLGFRYWWVLSDNSVVNPTTHFETYPMKAGVPSRLVLRNKIRSAPDGAILFSFRLYNASGSGSSNLEKGDEIWVSSLTTAIDSPWFSGDSTPEQLMQSPTIGSPLEGSLEDIAGPLVAELEPPNYSTTVNAIDSMQPVTVVAVINEERSSTFSDYIIYGNTSGNTVQIRSGNDVNKIHARYSGSVQTTQSLFNTPAVAISRIAPDFDYLELFLNGEFNGAQRIPDDTEGVVSNEFRIPYIADCILWAGLWSKALTEDEIAKVTLWLKQRYL